MRFSATLQTRLSQSLNFKFVYRSVQITRVYIVRGVREAIGAQAVPRYIYGGIPYVMRPQSCNGLCSCSQDVIVCL